MMHPPIHLTNDLFAALDLHPLVDELIALARSAGDGKAARTLVKSPELTVVAMALRAGASLLEHAAPGPVLVVPLRGRVTFAAPPRTGPAEVADLHALAMAPGLRHAVTAAEDSTFLLVIGGRPAD